MDVNCELINTCFINIPTCGMLICFVVLFQTFGEENKLLIPIERISNFQKEEKHQVDQGN